MKWKLKLLGIVTVAVSFFSLLVFVALFTADSPKSASSSIEEIEKTGTAKVSAQALKYRSLVEQYAQKEKIPSKIDMLLAIIEVETGGSQKDVMQASESKGLAPNTISDPEESIQTGVHYFAELVRSAKKAGVDSPTTVQAYNYGGGFIDYVAKHGKKYSFELAQEFSKEQAHGKKVTYTNPVAVKKNGGWRYNYGNMFYYSMVQQHLQTAESTKFDDRSVQKIMQEALKYEGKPYVFGGSNPTTSFDCSGLTQWCFKKAGIDLPRTAQAQYEVTQHLNLKEAKPGDLVFFHSTYDAGEYVTHVGIYVGKNRMYNAGDPIGYADLTTSYWQQHLIGAGRIKK